MAHEIPTMAPAFKQLRNLTQLLLCQKAYQDDYDYKQWCMMTSYWLALFSQLQVSSASQCACQQHSPPAGGGA